MIKLRDKIRSNLSPKCRIDGSVLTMSIEVRSRIHIDMYIQLISYISFIDNAIWSELFDEL